MTIKEFIKRLKYAMPIFLLCILFFGNNRMNTKADNTEELSTEITYGFQGIAEMGSHTPFTVSISNKGSEINGSVQVILSSFTEGNSATNSILKSSSKEKNYMYEKSVRIAANATTDVSMVIPLMNQSNKLKIIVMDEFGDILSTQEQAIEADDYYYYVYAAILCDEASIINYFQNTAIYQYNDFTYRSIILNTQDIPNENYALELFDVIIASQNQLDCLSKEQQRVIYNWKKNGGIIVNTDEIVNKQEISWENIIPESQQKKLNYTYRSFAEWSIMNALSNVFMNNKPNFMLYVMILVAYVAFLGPLLYIILKKLNKRKLFWVCEIAGSIFITVLIIGLGSTTRLNAPFINYFNIISYNANTIDDSVYFDIQAPFNNPYKLYLDKTYSFKPIYNTVYLDETEKQKLIHDYCIGISHETQENMITIKNDAAFTKEYFYAEKSEEKNGNEFVHVKMNVFGDKVSGAVTNNLDYPIENSAILLYNKVIFIDTIPANSTVSLDNMPIYTYNPKFKYGMTEKITGVKTRKNGEIEEGYMLQNQKKTILDFFLEQRFSVNTDEAYLIGFSSTMNQLDLQLDSAYDAYGVTMIEVPIDMNYKNGKLLYTAYVPIKNEEYSYSGDIMYSDEMILTYNLGHDLNDIELFFNELSYYDEEYYKTFSGHIYFYNRFTELYDPIDISNRYISSEQLKPYLDEENDIVIKYVEHFDKEEMQALLPSLSTIGRVNDAQN